MAARGYAALVAALLAVSLAGQAVGVYAAGSPRAAVGAAGEYVSRVEWLLNYTLQLAASANVTLPPALEERVGAARQLLAQARDALEAGDHVEAVRLATRAASTLAPVVAYVWGNMPADERLAERARLVEAGIAARERVLERVRALVDRLEASGAPVPQAVEERLARAEELLSEARQALEEGDAARARAKLRAFDLVVGEALRLLFRAEDAFLHRAAAAAAAAHGLAVALNATVGSVERAAALIEEGRTREAAGLLAGVEARLEAIANALDRIAEAAERWGAPGDAVAAIREAANHTAAAALYTAQAREALAQNDTATALLALNATLNELAEAVEALQAAGLPGVMDDIVHQAVRAREAVAWALEKHAAKTYAHISMEIDITIARLRAVKAKLDAGLITIEEARQAFQKALAKLERIKELLPPDAPVWLKAKLDRAIEWVEENTP